MSASQYEREYKHQLEYERWTVFRSAGSLAIDLVAIKRAGQTVADRKTLVRLIEVKSFKGDVFTVRKTKRMVAQWHEMMKFDKKFETYYSLRKKGQKTYRLLKPHALSKPYHWSGKTEYLTHLA